MRFFSFLWLASIICPIATAPIPFEGIDRLDKRQPSYGIAWNDLNKERELWVVAAYKIANRMIKEMIEMENDARAFDSAPNPTDRQRQAKKDILVAFGQRTWDNARKHRPSPMQAILSELMAAPLPLMTTDPEKAFQMYWRLKWYYELPKAQRRPLDEMNWPSPQELKTLHANLKPDAWMAITTQNVKPMIWIGEKFYKRSKGINDARLAATTLIHEMIHVLRKTSDDLVLVPASEHPSLTGDVRNRKVEEGLNNFRQDEQLKTGYHIIHDKATDAVCDFRGEQDLTPEYILLKTRSDTLWQNPDSWATLASIAWNRMDRTLVANPISSDGFASNAPLPRQDSAGQPSTSRAGVGRAGPSGSSSEPAVSYPPGQHATSQTANSKVGGGQAGPSKSSNQAAVIQQPLPKKQMSISESNTNANTNADRQPTPPAPKGKKLGCCS